MRKLNRHGVSMTEAIVVMPFFLIFVFGLLQLLQIGIGLIVVDYGAGSVARKMARIGSLSATTYDTDFQQLMVAGMKADPLAVCQDKGVNGNSPASNVMVTATAKIGAFPFIGPFVDKVAPGLKNNAPGQITGSCTPGYAPMLSFTGSPNYDFVVRGEAVARRNYLQ